ncbi:lysozyme inhibitor LprI family protein [Pararhizobium gei]|uniref:lysozyme inhibitor LprI family protein n=1 Tax=Pararhizobium gei TaxID=1395951 RepID=UPI0023DC9713|nr:lysozyme inhibitor LprI family protein [Rhizobium gei]
MKGMLFHALMLALATGPVQAADDCANASDQTTMTMCAGDALKKSDRLLNDLYKQIEARLKDDADTKKRLVGAQKAWLGFRDAECAFSSSAVDQGTVYPMIYAMCLDGLTQLRVKDLQTYLACEEGDLSCPVPGAD